MLIKKIIFYFFLTFTINLLGQKDIILEIRESTKKGNLKASSKKIDSILNLQKNNLIKGKLYLEKARILRIEGKNKSFLETLELIFKIAKKTNNKTLEAKALLEKYVYLIGKKKQTIPTLVKFVSIAEETQDNQLLFDAYLRISDISLKGNDHKKTREFHTKTLKYYRDWKKTNTTPAHLNLLLSRILKLEKKYDSAVFYQKIVLKQYKDKNRINGMCQIFWHLGDLEMKRKNYKVSYEWFLKCYKLANKINIKRLKEYSYSSIFYLLNEVNLAEKKSLESEMLLFFNETSLYSFASTLEKKLSNINISGARLNVLKVLSDVYSKKLNFKKSLFYANKWANLKVEKIEKEQLNLSKFMSLELAISNLNKQKESLEIENKLNLTHKIILILSIIIITILSLFIWSQQRLRIKTERLSKLTAESNFLKATKERINLEKTLEQKELELNSFVRDMIEKNSQIEILQNKLQNKNSTNVNELTEELKSEKFLASRNWVEFMFRFKQIHPHFLEKLKKNITNISPTETKLSILSFLNLSSKEIASLLGISATSVNQGKYRLKKKIGLDKDLKLYDFLQKI